MKQQEDAKRAVTNVKREEIEARKALERAQQAVEEAKGYLVSTTNALHTVEAKVKRSATEMDRVTTQLTKKQHVVRNTLLKKVADTPTVMSSNVVDDGILTEDELADLRRTEIQLMEEKAQGESMITKLQERSQDLKSRAIALDQMQKNGKASP